MADVDLDALKASRLDRNNPWVTLPGWNMDLIIAALEDRDRLRVAAQEVWDSIPASYESGASMVRRHAQALITLGAVLEENP